MNGSEHESRQGKPEGEVELDWVCPACGVEVPLGEMRSPHTPEGLLCPTCGAPLEADSPVVYRPTGGQLPRILAALFLLLLVVCLILWLVAMLVPAR
ncbi:MAG TPA: hypothetical protein PKK06_18020 [Phycisphaerae bacterium]|nr:hypothetical protein [Phycisphaerae bacterium]HNU47108.1 hypothetical protein [Phycisphaerae bacterium]